ncbi:MAG: hypothetical protein ABSD64_01070 [Terriglobales bacterium]|jgi:uncharacterized integral membrane protein
MPILMMALLALIVFGLIGILLTAAMILEHRKHAHATKGDAAHPVNGSAASPFNPKL